MKKLLFAFPIVTLLAASCNSTQSAIQPKQFSDISVSTAQQNTTTSPSLKATSTISNKLMVPVTEVEAVNLVTSLPEVQAYLARLKQNKSQGIVAADDKLQGTNTNEPYWDIHVYEDLSDHTATFNWYQVYKKTGQIKAQF